VLLNVTRSVLRTGEIIAGINALVLDASHVGRAAAISQTDRHRSFAFVDANADGAMVEHLAGLIRCQTGISYGARALTATADAGQVGGTFVIDTALYRAGSA